MEAAGDVLVPCLLGTQSAALSRCSDSAPAINVVLKDVARDP